MIRLSNKLLRILIYTGIIVLMFSIVPITGIASTETKKQIKIIDVAIGDYHLLALDSEGQVWAWGKNSLGTMGLGNATDVPQPKKITSLQFKLLQQVIITVWRSIAMVRCGYGDRMHKDSLVMAYIAS